MTDRVRDLILELRGTKCRCGARKGSGKTFCSACYYWLPQAIRQALYNRVGAGYEEAYDAAVRQMEGRDV